MGKEAKYLIHTCASRLWYVEEFLIPSMREQGIKKKNIFTYVDRKGEGQLKSLIKSYARTKGEDMWHLQDDIIISSRFKEMTEKYHRGVVCGFCNSYSTGQPGRTNPYYMWYSMPCIRIPDKIFKMFIEWIDSDDAHKRYKYHLDQNKHDDVLLQSFLQENMMVYFDSPIINLAPNIVNHIDHLIGGSIINTTRRESLSYVMSKYWEEPELITDLEQKIIERNASISC